MLPGVSGRLLSGAFLEAHVATTAPRLASSAEDVSRAIRAGLARCGPASAVRALLHAGAAPLFVALGYHPPSDPQESRYGLAATVHGPGGRVTLVVPPFGAPLDPLWRVGVTEAIRRSTAWCVLYNGIRLRLVDAGRLYARRCLEFDLDLAAVERTTAAALCGTLSAPVLCGTGLDPSMQALVAASERHAAGVCRSLRDGVLSASRDVLEALVHPRRRKRLPPLEDSFEQALTIVYRLLFLLFAEARSLVPVWHPVYRESYSVDALRMAAERAASASGLWEALRAMTRLAHTGCRAGDLRVTPFNGRLFAPARTPLADRFDLDDEKAARAVLALSTRPGSRGGARERITYRDLGVEQLGAVYETLLDYEPRVGVAGRVELRAESGVRKATGTFYTPQPIADYLVRRTLAPLVRDRTPDEILRLRVVDPAMGSGAFLVAACRYLAGAYEAALVAAGACEAADIDDRERVLFRRRIAERCLYGVDVNPMAVQLARLSLWLATLAGDRPLGFLDHRLQAGDSLIGAWLAQLRRPPCLRRRPPSREASSLFEEAAIADALREALPVRFSLESTPDDTLAQVRAKERAHAAATARDGALSRWKRVAHVWCAAWFSAAMPASAFASTSDFLLHGSSALPRRAVERFAFEADAAAAAHGFFHWELEFPEVFFDADGSRRTNPGFDAVFGNPPWDMVRADAGAARSAVAPFLRFTRDAGAYGAQGHGHANRYQLFVERAVALTRSRGRLGLVLPWGLAADHGSAALRRLLTTRCDIDALVGFDNHRGVFPIHRSVRFLLLTATAGASTREIACRFGVDDPAALESIGEERGADGPAIRLSLAAIDRLSGQDLTIPYVTTPRDLAIAERAAARLPSLGSDRGWSARFGRELNATDDREVFRPGQRGLPVIAGKQLTPFRVSFDGVDRRVAAADATRLLGDRYARPRLAYRDVASATNRVTLIAAVLPARCVSTHTVFCLRTCLPLRAQHFLCGLFNSLVVNYLVRLRVTTHVTTAIVEQLPLPRWEAAPATAREIAALARVLARREAPAAFARLNALVARLYQLSAAEFEHVLATFPLVDVAERERALAEFLEGRPRR